MSLLMATSWVMNLAVHITHMHTRTHTRTDTHTRAHRHTHTRTHTHRHTLLLHALSIKDVRQDLETMLHSDRFGLAYDTHADTHTQTHTRTHTHTHTHTHTQTHTPAHTHTINQVIMVWKSRVSHDFQQRLVCENSAIPIL